MKELKIGNLDISAQSDGRYIPFRWEKKEVFFNKKDTFVREHLEATLTDLTEQNQSYPQYYNKIIANAFLRGLYVARYMAEHVPLSQPVKIEARLEKEAFEKEPNTFFGAATEPYINVNNNIISIDALSEKELERNSTEISLDNIKILVNLPGLNSSISAHVAKFSEELSENNKSLTKKEINQQIENIAQTPGNGLSEFVGIWMEQLMVEEMAHTFYIANGMNNKNKKTGLLGELNSYEKVIEEVVKKNSDKSIPSECVEYLDSPIETRAQIWVRFFLRTYYPSQLFYYIAQQRFEEQQKRKQRTQTTLV